MISVLVTILPIGAALLLASRTFTPRRAVIFGHYSLTGTMFKVPTENVSYVAEVLAQGRKVKTNAIFDCTMFQLQVQIVMDG